MSAQRGEVHALISEAQLRADPIVGGLLATANGPTIALLTLYVARAELVRVAKERMPAAEWSRFLASQAQLERVFDDRCEVLQSMSASLLTLAGKG